MLTLDFKNDIRFIFNKLKEKNHFSFSKYADGEYAVLRNIKITNTDKWTFDPTIHTAEQQLLMDSFVYNHDDYYVGISCPCCQPKENVQWMRDTVKTKNVTYANIFVNSNYDFFKNHFISEFNKWDGKVIFIGNEKGSKNKLPFKVDYYHPIQIGSWLNPDLSNILEIMKNLCAKENNQLFLFSAGPLGNILAHELHLINKNNTYIDIGSTVNPWIVGNNRRYLTGKNNKICKWN